MRRLLAMAFLISIFGFSAAAQTPSAPKSSSARAPEIEMQTPVRSMPPEVSRRYETLHVALQPSATTWAEQQARIEAKRPAPDLDALRSVIRQRFTNSVSSPRSTTSARSSQLTQSRMQPGMDIEAMAFVVLMDASKDANDDLNQIMSEVKAINNAKSQLRSIENEINKEVAGSSNAKSAPCRVAICQSLPNQLRELSASTSRLQRPIRLQAPASMTYGQLQTAGDQVKSSLDTMTEMGDETSLRLQMAMDRVSKFMEALSNIEKKIADTDASIISNMK